MKRHNHHRGMQPRKPNPATALRERKMQEEFYNNVIPSLSGVLGNIYGSSQLSQTDTMYINNRWYLVSNQRQLLAEMYVEHGVIQTFIDQPVDDALRAGFDISTAQLSPEDVQQLLAWMEKEKVIQTIAQAAKWNRLFGGAAVMIITPDDPSTPFKPEKIKQDYPIAFHAVDMWELYYSQINVKKQSYQSPQLDKLNPNEEFYDYYGHKVHCSRLFRMEGKEAPSFVRPRLRGWGMSELERAIRSFNQYLKHQNVVFELMDEAKVDVFKITGFNNALLNGNGTQRMAQRIQESNMLKNINNALTMDANDDYQQKTLSFAGLSDILIQIRQGLAADLKTPITKLFGISASGWGNGEDSLENYNSMVEGEIRAKLKPIVMDGIAISCRVLFGFAPDDLTIEFKPLRILGADQQEVVKNHQFGRVMQAYQMGLATDKEAKQAINAATLVPVPIDETTEAVKMDAEEDKESDSGNQP